MNTNTNTNTRPAAVYPLAEEAPPTHYNHRGARHAPPPPPPQNEKCHQCIAEAIVFIFCASLVFIPFVVAIHLSPPNTPKIRVDSVSVSSFSVHSSTANHSVTSNWNIGFHVEKKNELMLWEEPEAVVSVFYKEVKLSSMLLHEYMSSDDVSLMVSKSTGTSSVPVTEQVAKAIEVDRSNGVVNLTIAIKGIFMVFLSSESYEEMMVRCGDVKVRFSHHNATTGTMLGESTKCKLY